MAQVKIQSSSTGYAIIIPPVLASDITLTTPSTTGVLTTTADVATLLQINISADYTITSADIGKQIYHPGTDTTARTVTIPAGLNIGTTFMFVNDTSAGVMSISSADTLMIAGAGTTGSPRTLAASGMASAVKIASAKWILNGAGLA